MSNREIFKANSFSGIIDVVLKFAIVFLLCLIALYVLFNFRFLAKSVIYDISQINPINNNEPLAKPSEAKTISLQANEVFIPSLDIKAPINYAEKIDEAYFQNLLQSGVVHYPGTAPVGESGNAYIFGHSSDFASAKGSFKTVFALLPKIAKGAEILASNASGKTFTYQIIETKIVDNNALEVLSQYENKQKLLTLQTSYPVGTALKRFIVIAEIVE